ncbi:substrate-binding domain-containing protein [Salsuginibacillus kocurii]|uniref:substrate-binding domain-containing protein n=1 Tax=Salsuginibacillus kocurii TaxID=427078 RepID=UPI00037D1042|nr:substrate-binding domain-containing protein [Salsuginibacillus kocurii]
MKSLKLHITGGITLLMLLAACGGDEESAAEGGDGSGDGDGDGPVIGMSFPEADHGFLGAIITNAQHEIEEQGYDHIMVTASDPNQQANDIDDLISQNVDIIVMLPTESDAMTPVAENIEAADIPLVVVDRELESDNYTHLVKGDNLGIGQEAGEYFVEELDGEGQVVEIIGTPSSVTDLRTQGFEESIEGSDIEVITQQSGEFQTEQSLSVMEDVLTAHSEIDAVYTHDDEMALGVLQAIEEAGRDDIQFVTGAGGHKGVYGLIQEDETVVEATFYYSPLMVKDGIQVAVDVLEGNPPEEQDIVLEATRITVENVDEFYDEDAVY